MPARKPRQKRDATTVAIARDLAGLDNMLLFARGWTKQARQTARRGRTKAALTMLKRLDSWLLDAIVLYRQIVEAGKADR